MVVVTRTVNRSTKFYWNWNSSSRSTGAIQVEPILEETRKGGKGGIRNFVPPKNCYIATLLHRYIATSLHRYIATYIATLLHCYTIATHVQICPNPSSLSMGHPWNRSKSIFLLLHCYIATSLHTFLHRYIATRCYIATLLYRYIATFRGEFFDCPLFSNFLVSSWTDGKGRGDGQKCRYTTRLSWTSFYLMHKLSCCT